MATLAESLFSSVVHDAAPRARAEALFVSVVHTAAPRARAELLVASVVHTTAARAEVEFLIASVVHNVVEVVASAGPGIQGSLEIQGVAQGSGLANLGPSAVGVT